MNKQLMRAISNYIDNQMTSEEKIKFEQLMLTKPAIKSEVEAQLEVVAIIKALKPEFKPAKDPVFWQPVERRNNK